MGVEISENDEVETRPTINAGRPYSNVARLPPMPAERVFMHAEKLLSIIWI